MKSLKGLFKHIKGTRKYFILALAFVAIETSFEVIIPFLMADIIDVGIMQKDPSVFLNRGFWMLLCALGSLVTGLLYARYASRASALSASQLRRNQFEKIMGFSFENIDHFESSSLVTRMTSDVMVLQNTMTNGIRPIARGPMMLGLGIVMCLLISWKLTLVFFLIIPFLAMIMVYIVKKVAPRYAGIQKATDVLNGVIEENLTAIRLVKSFVREDHEAKRFDEVNQQLAHLSASTNRYAFLNVPAFQASMYLAILVLLGVGSWMIMQNQMQVGELTGVLSYVLQIMNSFIMMSNVFLLLTRSIASINRIDEVFEEKNTMEYPEKGQAMEDGSIVFENVDFRYSQDAAEPVLSNLTLRVPSGTRLGVIGATGSGKTSLVSLIDRLYDHNAGSLKVGGHEIKDLDPENLHENMAMVLQTSMLFSGTVEENLRWGNPDATKEEIDEACHAAAVDEFLDRLPGGLQMELGQGGVNVSGGQKQRLCIARALLKKPKILILDDSTSAVDTRTDTRIRQALAMQKDMTQIIIAQRVSSISHCDQIIVMDEGRIIASGRHDELLETCPVYQEIFESQKEGGEMHE